jgi:hypothetical protein
MTEDYKESFADDPVAQGGQSGPLESLVYPLHLSIHAHEKIYSLWCSRFGGFCRSSKDWAKERRLQADCSRLCPRL